MMKIPMRRSVTPSTDNSLSDPNDIHDEGEADIDDFLLVKPRSTGMNGMKTKTRRQPAPMEKARATFDSAHLLSILLARDASFGVDFSCAMPSRDFSLLELLTSETMKDLDKL